MGDVLEEVADNGVMDAESLVGFFFRHGYRVNIHRCLHHVLAVGGSHIQFVTIDLEEEMVKDGQACFAVHHFGKTLNVLAQFVAVYVESHVVWVLCRVVGPAFPCSCFLSYPFRSAAMQLSRSGVVITPLHKDGRKAETFGRFAEIFVRSLMG